MNTTRNTSKKATAPVCRMPRELKARKTEIPELPSCSSDSSLYIEEIHYRAETVTPILTGIPGYSFGHDWN